MPDPTFRRTPAADEITAARLPRLLPTIGRTAPEALPDHRTGPAYVLPSSDWWIGVQAGYYGEQRTWHGNEERLVNELNSTETLHRPWGAGVMGGREYRSGWGLSLGAEYVSAQYDFKHEDRIITRTETRNIVLVTLNATVVASYLDTVVTIDEQRRMVEAVNRYAIVRVPFEASYHKGFGRWSYGLRAGVAAEYLMTRSGLTLADGQSDDTQYSVSVPQEGGRDRTSLFLSAGVGLDLGYALTERIGLWVTPAYTRGLTSFGDHGLYALPERAGVRLLLSYTLPYRP